MLSAQSGTEENLALKTDKPIDIDGIMSEAIWKKAPDAGLLIQQDPGEEDSGRFQTEVKILFDDGSAPRILVQIGC